MKLVLLTHPENLMSENTTLDELTEIGFDYLHIRKPEGDETYVTKIVNRLPKPLRSQMAIHSHKGLATKYQVSGFHHNTTSHYDENLKTEYQSKSFHSLEEIKSCKFPYKYGFLSPVFDSISKKGYNSTFDYEELKSFLHSEDKPFPIFALGGIKAENVAIARELGFDGVAVMGAVWTEIFNHKKLKAYQDIKDAL